MLSRHSNIIHSKLNISREFSLPGNNFDSLFRKAVGIGLNGQKCLITYCPNEESAVAIFNKLNGLYEAIAGKINLPKVIDIDTKTFCIYSEFITGIPLDKLLKNKTRAFRFETTQKVLREWLQLVDVTGLFSNYDTSVLDSLLCFNDVNQTEILSYFKSLSTQLQTYPKATLHSDYNATNILFTSQNIPQSDIYFIDYLNICTGPRLIDVCSLIIDPQIKFDNDETNRIYDFIINNRAISYGEIHGTLLFESIRKALLLRLIGKKYNIDKYRKMANWIFLRLKNNFYNLEYPDSLEMLNTLYSELYSPH